MKKIALLLALCLMVSLCAGCAGDKTELNGPVASKNYTFDCGASIDAPTDMKETEAEGYIAALDSRKVAMLLLEEGKPDNYSLSDYLYLLNLSNTNQMDFAPDAYGNTAASYVAKSSGDDWFYYVTVVESPTSFWLCQFACKETDRAKYEDSFAKWSATLYVPGGRVTQSSDAQTSGGVSGEVYQLDCGFTVAFEQGATALELDGYDAYYTTDTTGMVLLVENKAEYGLEGMTLEEYAQLLSEVNGYESMKLNSYGVYASQHTYSDGTSTFWYYTTAHETEDAFIMLQMFTFEELKDEYLASFEMWSAGLQYNG